MIRPRGHATVALAASAAIALCLSGCSPVVPSTPDARLESGYSEESDGSVRVVGTLERRDIEGGFWVVTQSSPGGKSSGSTTLAVIANGDEFADRLRELEGQAVLAEGTVSDGVSIRMAGPEIVLASISAAGDVTD